MNVKSNDLDTFSKRVNYLVSTIPSGKVMTYGQIASICGSPRSARIVGGIAHFGDPKQAWHRVVNKKGGLAIGYPGGRKAHKQALLLEKVGFNDKGQVLLTSHLYKPIT